MLPNNRRGWYRKKGRRVCHYAADIFGLAKCRRVYVDADWFEVQWPKESACKRCTAALEAEALWRANRAAERAARKV